MCDFFLQDCFILVAALNTICIGSVIYSSGTSLVRYLYVRSSLRTEVQDILKRDSFIISSIVVGECINLFNWGSFYYQQIENHALEKSPLVLYHACLNPWGEFKVPLHTVMPLNHLIIIILFVINISCNIFLYRYLSDKTENNSALNEVNRKKDRKRNLVPARLGSTLIFFYMLTVLLFTVTYSYHSDSFDRATRAFLNNVSTDLHLCICHPAIMVWGSKDARKKVKEILTMIKPVWDFNPRNQVHTISPIVNQTELIGRKQPKT